MEKEYASKKKGIITQKTGDPTTLLSPSKDSNTVYVGRADFIDAVDVQSGKSIWEDPKPSAGPPGFFCTTDIGLLSLPSASGTALLQNKKIILFNAETGDVKWEIALKPGVNGYLKTGDMMVVHLIHPSGKESINAFNLSEGKLLYKKEMMLKGTVVNMKQMKNGTLILGDEQLFIINQDGDYLGDQLEKSKKDKWITAADSNAVYLTSTGGDLVYKINMDDNKISRITPTAIQFEGKENIEQIEVFENTILLSSDQNIMALNKDTYAPIYQKYYKAPTKTTAGKILSGTQSLLYFTASLASAANTVLGAAFTGAVVASDQGQAFIQTYPEESNQLIEGLLNETGKAAKQTAANFKEAVGFLNEISMRFKASKNSQDHKYMLSYNQEGDLSILQVSKKDGTVASTVRLKKNDKNPDYLIDEAGKRLYYVPKVTSMEEITSAFKNELGKIICLSLK